ncbi:MAG TPA: oxygenase MpaB family protein [Chloroflexia bacterium]|jgi:hypothetical protein
MKYTDEALEALRREGDLLADGVIEALVAAGTVDDVNSVLRHFEYNDQPVPDDLPPVVREYLRITDNPPAWVDAERIKRAHAFFLDDGAHVASILCLGGMVGCYAVPHGAKLLSMTKKLDYPQRRLLETGQFCFYMMDEQAFQPKGRFIPSVQKVRLIHASIRRHLLQRGTWPVEERGVPICQEDMLGALMIFSNAVVDGMQRLGIHVTQEEAEDYYYIWRVTGIMLGIREDAIPETLADSHELAQQLRRRHLGRSSEGVELTQSLIRMYQDVIPGKVADGAIPALIRFVVGDEVADVVEVPRTGWDRKVQWLPKVMDVFEDAEDEFVLMRKVLDRAAWLMLNGGLRKFSGGHSFHYDIPEDLRSAWGIKED